MQPITREEIKACQTDIDNADTLVLLYNTWLALLLDSPDLVGISAKHLEDGLQWWRNYFVTTPFPVLAKVLDTLGFSILKELNTESGSPSMGEFLPWFARLPLVGKVYTQWYKLSISEGIYSDDEGRLQFLLSFAKFGKKSTYENDALKDIALREVLSDESDLNMLRVPGSILHDLRMVYCALFPRFTDESLHLKHGTGFVAEKVKGTLPKLQLPLVVDFKIYKKYIEISKKWKESRHIYGYGLDITKISHASVLVDDNDLITEGTCVPKDAGAVRFIGMEPSGKMLFQQGVLQMFKHTFKNTYVKHFIDLEDQTTSQLLALNASSTGGADTIDLSRASNRLADEVVKAIVPNSIRSHLDASRTKHLRVGDTVIKLKMASTMGSATTFPLQTSVFLSVVILAMLYHYYGSASDKRKHQRNGVPQDFLAPLDDRSYTWLHQMLPHFDHETLYSWLRRTTVLRGVEDEEGKYARPFVYGDDIIVASQVTPIVFMLLKHLGLVVNYNKSFTHTDGVREACGIYAAFGKDATPVTFKSPKVTPDSSIEVMHSLIGLANRLGKVHFENCRKHVLRILLKGNFWRNLPQYKGNNSILFTDDPEDTSKVYTTTPQLNWHLKQRKFTQSFNDMQISYERWQISQRALAFTAMNVPTSVQYQRDECRGFAVTPLYDDSQAWVLEPEDQLPTTDYYRYALASRLMGTDENRGEVDAYRHYDKIMGSKAKATFQRPSSYSISVGWTPLKYDIKRA